MSSVLPSLRTALLATALLGATGAQAAIPFSAITPSTTIPSCEIGTCGKLVWPVAEIADGIIADGSPFNGFAGLTGRLGTIRLDLDGEYDIDTFNLWNDINIVNEGVRSFRLDFFDTDGDALGSTGTLAAISKFLPNTYAFTAFERVSRVDMVILTVSGRVEIREVEFDGAVSAPIPEPGTTALMLLGLAGVAGIARRRKA